MKVLVVDDDAMVLLALTSMLEDLGHETVSADGGAEALIKLKEDGIQLMCTDLRMPHITGEELIGMVRQTHPKLPIIMFSGNFEYLKYHKPTSNGFTKLGKPFTSEALTAAITQAMEHHA
jgi:DNA-binding NtrC family response regulator